MASKEDLTGRRFERLLVLGEEGKNKHGAYLWKCRCDCGAITFATRTSLLRGHKRSCGCLMRESCGNRSRKHGLYKDRIYHIFYGMKQRCENPKSPAYEHYGGRGIQVKWKDWQSFREWALANGYEDGLTLDRIDVNGNYEPSNCRWITHAEQMRNTRKTRWLTFEGETKPLIEWCEILGVCFNTASGRVTRGWSDPYEILFGKKPKVGNVYG